ncbi:sensor histidine kinase [Xylanibacillus composti]|uniref:histidine kinase n=1 Tax=Xylanibacillus composti TaxID=1572762 RepID=A0A8J4H0B0_9BACL|nr:HAMP domain-containing sensor histidine kinase [Xylanibacillus composti]GIQ67195.1 two-component sensor histidine kinase [Xylanibacillus composti]
MPIHNPEFKRLALVLTSVCIGIVALTACTSLLSSHALRQAIVIQQAAIVGAAMEHAPAAEQSIVRQLQAVDPQIVEKGQAVLAAYGLEQGELAAETGFAGSSFRLYFLQAASLALLSFTGMALIFFHFLRKHYRRLHELSLYAEKIANGDESLDIRDNEEGQLSILKNGIYKMTTILREQKDALQQDKLHLADSIADISHQLKTPMTSLSVMTDLLEDEQQEEIRSEFLARMRAQLKRMEWLVTSLLKLSKLDAGTVTMKRERYDLRALVDHVLESLSIPLDIQMIEATVEGDSTVFVTGDQNWTREALQNVIKNGIEHTPEQGKLWISVTDNPLYARVTVTDSGQGIAKEDLPYVFQRFYRGANAGDDSVGIGLAMAHAIVKKQGGDIIAQNEEGKGATFLLTFYKSPR